jgi:hypothetical protein
LELSYLWANGGFFPTGVHGFLAGFQIAIFAFVGVELVGKIMIRIGIELIAFGKLRAGSFVSAAVVPTSSTPTKAKIGLWMIFTGFTSSTGEVASFTHLWANGGFFPTGVHGIELIAFGKLRAGSFVSAAVVPTSSTPTKAKIAIWKPAKKPCTPVAYQKQLTQFQSVSLFSTYWHC